LAPPFKKAQFEIIYGQGISKEGKLIDLGTTCNIVGKSGTWYSYQDDRLGQGKENAKNYLKENPKIATEIEKKIKDHLGLSSKEKNAEKKKEKNEIERTKETVFRFLSYRPCSVEEVKRRLKEKFSLLLAKATTSFHDLWFGRDFLLLSNLF